MAKITIVSHSPFIGYLKNDLDVIEIIDENKFPNPNCWPWDAAKRRPVLNNLDLETSWVFHMFINP